MQNGLVRTDGAYGYAQMREDLEALAKRYPFLEIGSAGKSVLGKEILFARVGTGKRRVLYHAAHHANEWITVWILMKYLEELCAGGEPEQVSLVTVPMVNPDGVDLVTGAVTSGDFYREARALCEGRVPFPHGWKANRNGVDLNLNYPAGWEQARKNKAARGVTAPAPRDYVGPHPFSEPETQALAALTYRTNPDCVLAYHTQGREIYWNYAGYEPPESERLAEELARRSGYTAMRTPEDAAYAGYKDWFLRVFRRPGFTVEAGLGVSPLPPEEFAGIYAENKKILQFFAEEENSI